MSENGNRDRIRADLSEAEKAINDAAFQFLHGAWKAVSGVRPMTPSEVAEWEVGMVDRSAKLIAAIDRAATEVRIVQSYVNLQSSNASEVKS